MIELTYGPNVDWYKNVQAAGGCTILWHGKPYTINKLEPMDPKGGRAAFPAWMRLIMNRLDLNHFVRFTSTQPR
jgi:hypothetical protein